MYEPNGRSSYPLARWEKKLTMDVIQPWTLVPALAGAEMIHTTMTIATAQTAIFFSNLMSPWSTGPRYLSMLSV